MASASMGIAIMPTFCMTDNKMLDVPFSHPGNTPSYKDTSTTAAYTLLIAIATASMGFALMTLSWHSCHKT
jgi:hypothetical protein